MSVESKEEFGKKIYKYASGYDQVKSEASYGFICESIEINNGIYLNVMGMEYPEKGVASAEDIFATNMVKRLTIEVARLAKYFLPSIVIFALLPYKMKIGIANKFLRSYGDVCFKLISPHILQPQHLTPMAQELNNFIYTFFKEIGIEEQTNEKVTEILVNVINFDNAYRYRLQDLFDETTIEKLSNPRKEFKRLLLINLDREVSSREVGKNAVVHTKFKLFYWALSTIMLHPKIKRAYLIAIKQVDLSRLQMDKADWFWTCVRDGYNYHGKTDKERKMLINHLKYVIPTKLVL